VEFANYRSSTGGANLTLIAYPHRNAGERLKAISDLTGGGGPFYFKRTGRWWLRLNGNIPESVSPVVLASVNYDADYVNPPTKPNRATISAAF